MFRTRLLPDFYIIFCDFLIYVKNNYSLMFLRVSTVLDRKYGFTKFYVYLLRFLAYD